MKLKVKYRKLGKEKSFGMAHSDGNLIELDTRLKGKKHLEILTHEALHLLFPKLTEEQVISKSVSLTNLLWSEGYRRTDNTNNEPLQDGSL